MKIDKCKWFGHKWTPIFMKGEYGNVTLKFIACYCERCRYGEKELHETNNKMTKREYGTEYEKYFDK